MMGLSHYCINIHCALHMYMGVGTGPAGPAAAGPIFSQKKKNKKKKRIHLANMGMGTGDYVHRLKEKWIPLARHYCPFLLFQRLPWCQRNFII